MGHGLVTVSQVMSIVGSVSNLGQGRGTHPRIVAVLYIDNVERVGGWLMSTSWH